MTVWSDKTLPHPPRPAIRRTRRGDQKAEQIRSAAAKFLLRHGFDGVSADEMRGFARK
jgi:AcrR family transcriptional regulator